MSRREYPAPRLLLSARALDGASRATRERLLEIQARFHEPESLAVTLVKAVEAGSEGVLSSPSAALRAALAELDRTIPLVAVLPALRPQEYRLLEPGVEPLLARSRRDVGSGWRLVWRGLLRGRVFRAGDFAARVPLLLEAEASRLPRRGLESVVIAAPLTDAALAGGHRVFFESTARFVRGRFRAAAGFETRNPGVLLRRLREWSLRPDFVVGPVNPRGLGMKPSLEETRAELARSAVPLVATEVRASGLCTLAEGAQYARSLGAHGLALDLAETDEVSADLRRLAGEPRE